MQDSADGVWLPRRDSGSVHTENIGLALETALRVVAFNPNPAHRQWVACAGPSGLLACVRVPSGGKPSGKPKGRPPKAKAPKAGTASGVWVAVDDDEVGHGMPLVSDPE